MNSSSIRPVSRAVLAVGIAGLVTGLTACGSTGDPAAEAVPGSAPAATATGEARTGAPANSRSAQRHGAAPPAATAVAKSAPAKPSASPTTEGVLADGRYCGEVSRVDAAGKELTFRPWASYHYPATPEHRVLDGKTYRLAVTERLRPLEYPSRPDKLESSHMVQLDPEPATPFLGSVKALSAQPKARWMVTVTDGKANAIEYEISFTSGKFHRGCQLTSDA